MSGKNMSERVPFNREMLHDLYIVQRLTAAEIGRRTGYSKSWITSKLGEFGIPRRTRRGNFTKGRDLFPASDDWLREQYVVKRRSLDDIGKEIGWLAHSVRRRLIAAGVPMRSHGGQAPIADREWLLREFWGRNRSLTEIAAELGCGLAFLRREMRRLNVPRKPRSLTLPTAIARGFRRRPMRPEAFSDRQRLIVLRRDGGQCRMCGSQENLECHHIIPVRFGGTSVVANGIAVCETCHFSMHKHELAYVERLLALRGKA